MTLVIPRLDRESARAIVEPFVAAATPEERPEMPNLEQSVTYPPIGGTRITHAELVALREAVVSLAISHGMPAEVSAFQAFDSQVARVLHEKLDLTPHEASFDEVWS